MRGKEAKITTHLTENAREPGYPHQWNLAQTLRRTSPTLQEHIFDERSTLVPEAKTNPIAPTSPGTLA